MPPAHDFGKAPQRFWIHLLLGTAFFSFLCAPAWAAETLDDPCAAPIQSDQAAQANHNISLLEAGNSAYEAGDLRKAENAWTVVSLCPHTSPNWPKATFNLGLLEVKQRHFARAIEHFQAVLDSHPNDKEPGANIMQVYRNYSHRGALAISECYEEMGQFRQALHYARLARTRYPYQSWCGTCQMSAQAYLARRIAYLTFRAYGIQVMTTALLGGVVLLRWKKAKRPQHKPQGSIWAP